MLRLSSAEDEMKFSDVFEESVSGCARDEYADSNVGSVHEVEEEEEEEEQDEEEVLSLCDLVTGIGTHKSVGLPVEWKSTLRESNPGSLHLHDLDFDFGRSGSTAHNICPADVLFHKGHLLPLTVQRCGSESSAHFSYRKSNSQHENRHMLNEKMQAWRTDSLPRYWTTFSSSNPQALQRQGYCSASQENLQRGSFATPSSNSTSSKANRTTKPPHLACKTRLKWQQFFTLGLMKTPPMKLEDLRLKQGKPINNAVDNSVIKRSVSCNYHEGLMIWKKQPTAVKFEQRSKSIKENMCAEETARSKGWKMLAPFRSVNSCTSFTNPVMKKPVTGGRSAEISKLPFHTDQNSLCSAKIVVSNSQDVQTRPTVLRSTAKRSRSIFPKLLFRSMFTFRSI